MTLLVQARHHAWVGGMTGGQAEHACSTSPMQSGIATSGDVCASCLTLLLLWQRSLNRWLLGLLAKQGLEKKRKEEAQVAATSHQPNRVLIDNFPHIIMHT